MLPCNKYAPRFRCCFPQGSGGGVLFLRGDSTELGKFILWIPDAFSLKPHSDPLRLSQGACLVTLCWNPLFICLSPPQRLFFCSSLYLAQLSHTIRASSPSRSLFKYHLLQEALPDNPNSNGCPVTFYAIIFLHFLYSTCHHLQFPYASDGNS